MYAEHAEREKPHLPICACTIGDLELILKIEVSATSDATGPEKQGIYLPWPKPPILVCSMRGHGPSCRPSATYVGFVFL